MRNWLIIACMLALSGCGREPKQGSEKLNTFDVNEPDTDARSGPQIAYTYELTYQLPSSALASVQGRQLRECRALGSQRCLILKSTTASTEDGAARGSVSLVIDARLAETFNRRLDTIATGADGTVLDRSVAAEDVTKQVIDTGARVRAKEALAARLLSLIGSARGNVGELVEAEKAYATTQEELDAARSLQDSLRRRVAMSQIDITYEGSEPGGAMAPVSRAIASAGSTLAESLRVLVTAAIALLPWVLVWFGLRWVARRLGWRGPVARLCEWRARRVGG